MPSYRRKKTSVKKHKPKKTSAKRKKVSTTGKKLDNVSAASLLSELKSRKKTQLGKQLVARELATTKTKRKKIGKTITKIKSELKRLD